MSFDLIDPNGLVDVIAPGAAEAVRGDGFLRTLYLDANLTLDLANVGAGKCAVSGTAVRDVLHFAAASETAIDYGLAVEELARGALRSAGDATRGSKLRGQIAAGTRLIDSQLDLGTRVVPVAHLGRAELDSYMRVHLAAYTHLLRIEQIAKARPGKAAALKNVSEYLRWANDIANVTAYCLQVALDVYCGRDAARRCPSYAEPWHPSFESPSGR